MPGIIGPGGISSDAAGYKPPAPPWRPSDPTEFTRPADRAVDFPAGRNSLLSRMPLRLRQQYLKSHGYNVNIDGKPGAQTMTATKAFIKGIPAHYWNQVWARNHPAPVQGTRAVHPGQVAPHVAPHTAPAVVAPTPGQGPAPAPAQNQMVNLPGMGKVSIINPAAYANAAMDAKYGGAQSDLARQLAQAEADQKGHQTDIQNWFSAILGDQKSGAAANVAALKGVLQGADASNQGLVNALGGSANAASSEVAGLGQIGRNALEQLAANQANFDDSQRPALARQGVDTANQEYAKGQTAKDDLNKQLATLAQTRGADYAATLTQAQQDRFKQQLALHDARVSDIVTGHNITNQNTTLAAQRQGQALDNQGKLLNLQYLQAKTAALKAAGNGQIDWTNPATANNWNDAVTQTITDRNGALATSPQAAWVQIQHEMARNGLSGNAKAMSIAQAAVQDALNRSHARGMFKNWTWGPKGLVNRHPKKK